MNETPFTDIRAIDTNAARDLTESVPYDRRAKKGRKEDLLEMLPVNLEYGLSLIMSGSDIEGNPDSNVTVGIRLISILIRQLREAA